MNVLIVDDDMATVDVICKSVNWSALHIDKVMTAYNIEKAKEMLADIPADIVVCDIEMPMGNGTELLKWVRENDMSSEFLFLTCHTEFQYASVAIRYQAAGYLVKPFRVEQVEAELLHLVQRIMEKRKIEEESHYGKWMRNNQEQLMNNFWRALTERELRAEPEFIDREIKKRRLPVLADQPVCLIGVRVAREEQAKEALGENLLEFTLEKMVSEIVDESVENTSVIKKIVNEALFFLVIDWKRTLEEVLMERCHMLIKTGQDYVGCCFTCCIGTPCSMEQLPDKADEVVNLLLRNVLESDQVFREKRNGSEIPFTIPNTCPVCESPAVRREGEAAVTSGFNTRLLDLKQMENDLRNKDRMKILNTVKTVLGKLSREKSVSVETLLVIQQEILQLIYTNLYQNGIQAAELFGDEVSRKIQRQSVRSVFDMIKWVNYAISRTLEYEDEINRSLSLADKIESYVKEHYKEDISRDTIADVFFLTPEYLAKVYKRQTGHNLKDYIIGYRIEMAKQLLADDIKSISDISAEVGFDNFSYFSTVFKKYTGITPGEYRRSKKS